MPRSCSGVASRVRMTMGAIAPLVVRARSIAATGSALASASSRTTGLSRSTASVRTAAMFAAVENWIPLPLPSEQHLRTRSPVAGEAETRMTEKTSACIDLKRCFRWTDAKGCHGPVNNSLTKLDRLPLDPALLQRVPFLAARGAATWQAEPLGSVTNQTYRVTGADESYVVRVAGPTTHYLDRWVVAP